MSLPFIPPIPPPSALLKESRSFLDVPTGHWAAKPIENMKNAGVFVGYPDGRFGLGEPMLREQAAAAFDKFTSQIRSGSVSLGPNVVARPEMSLLQSRVQGLEGQVKAIQETLTGLFAQSPHR